MKKEIIYDKNAIKEFNQFDMSIQKDFVSYFSKEKPKDTTKGN